jgi:hypothetical protein
MKKILFSTILIFTINSAFSQTYDIFIIEKPHNTLYDFAKDMGKIQSEMQQKYDYNNERLNNAISNISDKISSLNYPITLKDNIRYGWKQIINEINNCSSRIDMMSNSSVSNAINLMTSSINKVIANEVKLYNGSRLYNNYEFDFCNKTSYSNSNNNNYYAVEFGKSDLNYRFSLGYGFGLNSKSNHSENVNEIIATIRLGKKTTLENLFEKFSSNSQNNIPENNFKKQFALTSIYNYHISFFSKSLFMVAGIGASYSKNYISNDTFEIKINPVINLGFDYNFKKIPLSLGFYDRLNFGKFSSVGISTKFLIR